MARISRLFVAVCAAGLAAVMVCPAGAQTQPAGACHAILVGGLPGSPVYARRFQDWLKRFHAHLTKTAGVPARNVVVLSGDKGFADPIVNGPATSESILKAIEAAARAAGPGDQFVLVIVGHGSLSDEVPGLALPGADLTGEALGKALGGVLAQNQVVLNFSGVAGSFLTVLEKRGRVNVAATSEGENADPAYAEFYLRGLESGRADGAGAAKDGTVTVLEAYNWAAHQTALWISRQVGQEDGTWALDGKESVEIFRKVYDGPEGPITAAGQRADGSRKLAEGVDGAKADEVVPIVVPREIKPNEAAYWEGRRVVNEHAQLEDCGSDMAVCALRGETGYEPITAGKAGEEGALAGRAVLGRAQLLTGVEK